MSEYHPPGYPSAIAARRRADLESQKRKKTEEFRRQDRRREAFRTMKRRYRIVKEYRARRNTCSSEGEAARQTSERFSLGISSVRRHNKMFSEGGKRGLLPSYQKRSSPGTQLPFEIIQIILTLRIFLGWCGQRISNELRERGIAVISHMTVYRIFKRYRVRTRTYHPEGRSDGIRYKRQVTKTANRTWHIDFAGPWEDSNGVSRSLLLVIDSYSRMLLYLGVVPDQKTETVKSILTDLFERYGAPCIIITDNGRAFAPAIEGQEHRFPKFLSENGVEHRLTRPYYPQTNGKAEAAVKIVERELIRLLKHDSGGKKVWYWSEISEHIPEFQAWYNFYRAHGAIGYQVPARLYAGITMPKQGLENIFRFLPESRVEPEKLPQINRENRLDNLSLVPLS